MTQGRTAREADICTDEGTPPLKKRHNAFLVRVLHRPLPTRIRDVVRGTKLIIQACQTIAANGLKFRRKKRVFLWLGFLCSGTRGTGAFP